MINRAAIILKYKEPAIRWVNNSDPNDGDDATEVTAEEINRERIVYLITDEDADTDESVSHWIEVNYLTLFENELDGWVSDESMWPQNLSLDMFYEWFEVECHTLIVDTVGEPIEDEEGELSSRALH